ncbi:MobV family relaxase [Streptococcus ruminantium]|uniref:MobV family relaxase n=1 Tax=Streptococcus ruminantium TaxID=1917441 RepID=A0ABU1B3D5_9STRE|nr:MobV family relaxase [Streptococcus ruminantium]MDQ8759988.1 MobV family relaxase [Streptococcus ruminantium]MDQ8765318.1 MobV family relaxase [Streptococcus ruminantium]MDQ8769210.1 MobV family relaxase [Streptococcus ruminantium]MDQ8775125.1 MobV family relaxase [Streptococcus ruminantium]MDQ8794517.1 MobV family relaxase [Streptococcus ruminantium]
MAHLEKYTSKELPHLLKHDERARGVNGEYLKFGNESIDTSRSHLNYNLHERNDGLSDYEFIKQRAMKYLAKNVRNRADVNWVGSWIITLPESLKNASEADKRRFFEASVRFVGERYGYENLVGAYVHNDETTPHVHIKITPVFWDKKKKKHKFSAKELFSIDDLKKFHPELSKHLEREFGFDVGVWADKPNARSKAYNKTIEELKRETAEAADLKEVVVHETRTAYDELTDLRNKKGLSRKK